VLHIHKRERDMDKKAMDSLQSPDRTSAEAPAGDLAEVHAETAEVESAALDQHKILTYDDVVTIVREEVGALKTQARADRVREFMGHALEAILAHDGIYPDLAAGREKQAMWACKYGVAANAAFEAWEKEAAE
jgi:hypothetical protein